MSGDERLAERLERLSVCVCAGPGGVGKTTISAALGLAMARRGRRVAVLTIDPAKRLADSLGVELGGEPVRVTGAGLEGSEGELWALQLDPKSTFDGVVARHAPDQAARERILSNRIYQQISGALAGSQEYSAMEKLYELVEEGRFELIVLDTPPSRNALDFLEAPRKLLQFIEGRSMQLFLKPTGLGMRILGRGGSVVMKLLNRITGVDLLEDLSEFFGAMGGMVDGFRERSERVEALLADPGTGFVIVTSPRPEPIAEALFFRDRVAEDSLTLEAVVANRVHQAPEAPVNLSAESLPPALRRGDLPERLAASAARVEALAERDRAALAELERALGTEPLLTVPEQPHDIVDGTGLGLVTDWLGLA